MGYNGLANGANLIQNFMRGILNAAKDGLFPWLELRLSSNICCTELICLVEQTEHLGQATFHSNHQSLCSLRKYLCSGVEFTCGNITNSGTF